MFAFVSQVTSMKLLQTEDGNSGSSCCKIKTSGNSFNTAASFGGS